MPEAASTVVRHIKLISFNQICIRNVHDLHLGDTCALFQVDALIEALIEVKVDQSAYRPTVLLIT